MMSTNGLAENGSRFYLARVSDDDVFLRTITGTLGDILCERYVDFSVQM